MSATLTTRLGIIKPTPGTGEPVNLQTQINDSWDKIDSSIGATICTSGTRPSVPFHGQLIRETDTRRMYVWNATQSAWDQIMSAGGSFASNMTMSGNLTMTGNIIDNTLRKYKSAAQTVNNSTVMVNCNHLFVSVVPGIYIVDAFLLYTSLTADIKIGFSGPAATTFDWSAWGQGTGATTFEGVIKNERRTAAQTSGHGGTSSDLSIRPTGTLQITNSGTFRVQFAQEVAVASDTILRVGSWLRLERLS